MLFATAAGIAAGFTTGCRAAPPQKATRPASGRLLSRPGQSTETPTLGLSPLGLGTERDGALYVPSGYRADKPARLVLMLHGAGGAARGALRPLMPHADDHGLILLAPDSRGHTWDFLSGPFGPDVEFIDRTLSDVFRRCAVNPSQITIEGFSDGASYALSLGLTNGDFFSRILAFSPCILAPAAYQGSPRVFITHGTNDQILPIERCSRRIVPQLRERGYRVDYREFTGPHTVTPELASAAADWIGRG
jgi:phospholipase/carboxylesterase